MASRCTWLLVLLIWGGCRFLSSDEDSSEPDNLFEATIDGLFVEGETSVDFADGGLIILGTFLRPDSSRRFIELRLPVFEGEALYPLERNDGRYGAPSDTSDAVDYGYSIGRPEDQVRISQYDDEEGVLRGEFFFYGQALFDVDGMVLHDAFTASGRFRALID